MGRVPTPPDSERLVSSRTRVGTGTETRGHPANRGSSCEPTSCTSSDPIRWAFGANPRLKWEVLTLSEVTGGQPETNDGSGDRHTAAGENSPTKPAKPRLTPSEVVQAGLGRVADSTEPDENRPPRLRLHGKPVVRGTDQVRLATAVRTSRISGRKVVAATIVIIGLVASVITIVTAL